MTHKLSYSTFKIMSKHTYHLKGYRVRRSVEIEEVEIFTTTDEGRYIKVRESISFIKYLAFLKSLKVRLTSVGDSEGLLPLYIIYKGSYISIDDLADEAIKEHVLKYIEAEHASPMKHYLARHFIYNIRGKYVLKTDGEEHFIEEMMFMHDKLIVRLTEETCVFDEPVKVLDIPYSWILFSNNNSNLSVKVPHPFNSNKTLFQFKIEEDGIL